ncbi:metal-dependent hydrolase family protein [Actinopolymorpha rutila]|uniref:Imidazolonepropionase-like amidohydrolase n=1 Tax=Actinopolymorpha rutila TaxID=446787 RepID=A0A852ZJF6_9ACTN|nr:amidohydrolase family protein [Actinopolymorpha rutila]NYH92265.1 imidazolonepropionase-like amidohydrolase [Actinopolymorpha rutila]
MGSSVRVFRHARLLACNGDDPLDDATVVVEDGVIRDVARGDSLVHADDVIDCRGRTLMPGLIDAHVHVCSLDVEVGREQRDYPTSLLAYEIGAVIGRTLDQGYTTVRDAGGADWGMKEAVARGLIPGPRMFVSGRPLSQTGGHGDSRSRAEDTVGCGCGGHIGMVDNIADGPDGVRRAVREQLRRGADAIKVMASGGVASPTDRLDSLQYTREELQAVVDEAGRAGTYVLAHAYSAAAIRNAVEAGVRSIEHGNFLDEDTARLMAERGTFLVPTFVAYEKLHEHGRELGFAREKLAKLDEVLGVGLEGLERARDAGVRIASGSDLLGSLAVHRTRELAIKAQVLGAHETLVATTRTNAELLGIDHEVGTVEPDKRADLIVVDGDPLADIAVLADLDRIQVIMQAGEFHKREL